MERAVEMFAADQRIKVRLTAAPHVEPSSDGVAAAEAEAEAAEAAEGSEAEAAAPEPSPTTTRIEVSFLLCTVIFYANLAHSLTRSP